MNEKDFAQIKLIIDASLEMHLAAVHEEISEVGTELRTAIDGLAKDSRYGFDAASRKISRLDTRVDNEGFARSELERRVRRVLPDLPKSSRP
ncbi:MAG: hypothetical protein Q8M24_05095 [Pseudolabrys sp.]|nr:hypothetical protein [Pseudolabrys sp.]MDP2294822.1 hypothetical protein [Pseudolabrys sp.]